MSVGAAILVVALVVLATVLSRMFGDVGGPLDKQQLGLKPVQFHHRYRYPDTTVVKPTRATVFSPGGEADNPDQASQAIDGNPATGGRRTPTAMPMPFPNFKNGVRLILQLPTDRAGLGH